MTPEEAYIEGFYGTLEKSALSLNLDLGLEKLNPDVGQEADLKLQALDSIDNPDFNIDDIVRKASIWSQATANNFMKREALKTFDTHPTDLKKIMGGIDRYMKTLRGGFDRGHHPGFNRRP